MNSQKVKKLVEDNGAVVPPNDRVYGVNFDQTTILNGGQIDARASRETDPCEHPREWASFML
jgi:hypothetical protein